MLNSSKLDEPVGAGASRRPKTAGKNGQDFFGHGSPGGDKSGPVCGGENRIFFRIWKIGAHRLAREKKGRSTISPRGSKISCYIGTTKVPRGECAPPRPPSSAPGATCPTCMPSMNAPSHLTIAHVHPRRFHAGRVGPRRQATNRSQW